MTRPTCPVCAHGALRPILDLPALPVFCNVLSDTRDEALRIPRGPFLLTFCGRCGHLFNAAFERERLEYDLRYENSLHFSPRFQTFAHELAASLVERYDLHDKAVLEVGCGQGDFLRMLCDLGPNRGFGFDPSYAPVEGDEPPFEVVRDYFSPRYGHLDADLVCCRHVLEHVPDPRAFAGMLREAVRGKAAPALYVEVPNALATLRDLAVWDLIYEHYSYFTPPSLSYLLRAEGWQVTALDQVFGGQYLSAEATPGEAVEAEDPDAVADVERFAGTFATRFEEKRASWRRLFEAVRRTGRRAVLWGAGSKGVTMLNLLDEELPVTHVVDVNPRKHGRFVAGTGHEIVPPEALVALRPDVVVVMNPLYEDEIRRALLGLGLEPDLLIA